MPEKNTGLFITLEGGEGAGKSTQGKLLVEYLTGIGIDVVYTREPGGTQLAEKIRQLVLCNPQMHESIYPSVEEAIPEYKKNDDEAEEIATNAEVLLMLAARAQHVRYIRACLAKGMVVVCDRFSASTFAYQVAGRGLEEDKIKAFDNFAREGLSPDLTIFFDMPVRDALARKRAFASKGGEDNRFDSLEIAFHEKVLEGFHKWLANHNEVVAVDSTRQIDEVAQDVRNLVLERLKR